MEERSGLDLEPEEVETVLGTQLSYVKWVLILVNLLLACWTVYITKTSGRIMREDAPDRKGNVLFVIAHPDDEAMFFVPSIRHFVTQTRRGLHLLCLSSGDSKSSKMGEIRTEELVKSCAVLGIPNDRISVINEEGMKDGFDKVWDTQKIAEIVTNHVEKNDIQSVITFDGFGVSGHPNHIATYKGVKSWIDSHRDAQNTKKQKNNDKGDERQEDVELRAFQLVSVSIFRKFVGVLDVLFTGLMPGSDESVFVSFDYFVAHRAMTSHASQFVWFRRLFLPFSRFTFVNALREM